MAILLEVDRACDHTNIRAINIFLSGFCSNFFRDIIIFVYSNFSLSVAIYIKNQKLSSPLTGG